MLASSGCKWWFRQPKVASSVISDVKLISSIFTFTNTTKYVEDEVNNCVCDERPWVTPMHYSWTLWPLNRQSWSPWNSCLNVRMWLPACAVYTFHHFTIFQAVSVVFWWVTSKTKPISALNVFVTSPINSGLHATDILLQEASVTMVIL